MIKFKVGNCIRDSNLFGEVIEIHDGKRRYRVKWYDKNPETTNEDIDDVDNMFDKISRLKLITLAI